MADARILALCADDFGLSDGVDGAIIDLIGRGRLSATSCMVGGQSISRNAASLVATAAGRADIGLHLTFTDLSPLGPMPRFAPAGQPPSLGQLLRRAYTGGLDATEIAAEVGRQIERFGEIFGRAPDFVDGHQHAHLLPPVRASMWQAFRSGQLPKSAWVRNCAEGAPAIRARGIEVPKCLFISLLSSGMAAGADRLGIATNDSFRGITAFRTDQPFGPTFARFLSGPGLKPLAMCHPGLPDHTPDPTDAIPIARTLEYAYFSSDAFAADLAAANLRIGRWGRG